MLCSISALDSYRCTSSFWSPFRISASARVSSTSALSASPIWKKSRPRWARSAAFVRAFPMAVAYRSSACGNWAYEYAYQARISTDSFR
jgi:hypothetical protein